MKLPVMWFASLLALAATPALAGKAVGDMHPEEAYPDNLPQMASPGPYAELIKQVQARLHDAGFDAGPVNGDFGTKTQAALAQFQLANVLPASGMLDTATLLALGVDRAPPEASVEASAQARESAGTAAAGSTSSK